MFNLKGPGILKEVTVSHWHPDQGAPDLFFYQFLTVGDHPVNA